MNIFGKILSAKTILLALLLIGILSIESYSQKKEEVRISPKAAVMQTVGFTNVTIDYSRPGVKGRTIWGGLGSLQCSLACRCKRSNKNYFQYGCENKR